MMKSDFLTRIARILWIIPVVFFILAGTGYLFGRPLVDVSSPYDAVESLNWLKKTIMGLSRDNPSGLLPVPVFLELNGKIKTRYTITFVGDIMPLGGRELDVSAEIKGFIAGSDYIVGNFEGTIAGGKPLLPFLTSDLYHTGEIIRVLSGLFPPEKTYLSVANNHAGDLGEEKFFSSVRKLEQSGFNVFGWDKKPFFDINDNIRIISGTAWSNRKRDYVLTLVSPAKYIKQAAFNVLYPHFGYELELYPRRETVDIGKVFLNRFDALIGHHSHCPQPVTVENIKGMDKISAYSLGDFLGELTTKKYQYGIMLKMGIGRNNEGRWVAVQQRWILTRCAPGPGGQYILDKCDETIW